MNTGSLNSVSERFLCSLVRRGVSIESCPGIDCSHEHGKMYEIEELLSDGKTVKRKYTCVKIAASQPFPVWTNAVNKIMCQ